MTTPTETPDPAAAQRPTARRAPGFWTVTGWLIPAGVFLVVGLFQITDGFQMAWDESVYALRTRSFAEGDVDLNFWGAYRAPGLPLLHVLPWWLTGPSDAMMRATVHAFGTAGIVLTGALTWRLIGARASVVAATLLAITPGYYRESIRNLPDVPGAVLGLATIVVFVAALDDDRGVRPWILAVIPLAMAATYVRYGAPLPIGIPLAAYALLRWSRVREHLPLVAVTGVSTAVGAGAVLLIPALTWSDTSPRAAIEARYTVRAGGRWQPLGDFLDQLDPLLGFPLQVMVIAGLVLAFTHAVRHRDLRGPIASTALALMGTLLALAYTLDHGEPRYLAPLLPLTYLIVGGGLVALATLWHRSVAVGLLALLGLVGTLGVLDEGRQLRAEHAERFGVVRELGGRIGATVSEDCAVITDRKPQVGWYSGCDVFSFPDGIGPGAVQVPLAAVLARTDRADVVVVLFGSAGFQPHGQARDALVAHLGDPLLRVGDPAADGLAYAEVYELRGDH